MVVGAATASENQFSRVDLWTILILFVSLGLNAPNAKVFLTAKDQSETSTQFLTFQQVILFRVKVTPNAVTLDACAPGN